MSIDASPPAQPPQISPDGKWVWDGSQWLPMTAGEATHEAVFKAWNSIAVEPADPVAEAVEPVAVRVAVQAAPPEVDYPYPAPAVDYPDPAAEPIVPLWEQPKSSGKSVYLYTGAAIALFVMVLIVLNSMNFFSLPFLGAGTSSSPAQAAKPSPAPGPGVRSEFGRAEAFLNGPFDAALASFDQTLPAWQVCTGDSLSNSCFDTISATDQQMTHLLSVIDHGAIPPCIAPATTKLRYDLSVMATGLKLALEGYKNNSVSDLSTGMYHFRRFGAFLQSDIAAIRQADKTQCSHDLEGP